MAAAGFAVTTFLFTTEAAFASTAAPDVEGSAAAACAATGFVDCGESATDTIDEFVADEVGVLNDETFED